MTPQEVFDAVVAHLRQQGQKAMQDGQCKYRAPGGLKCALGCLISDEDYNTKMELHGTTILSEDWWDMIKLPRPEGIARLDEHEKLLSELQACHDHNSVHMWEERFKIIAKNHSLVYLPPTQVAG